MFISMIRALILYVCVIAGMRFMGKRQIGELEPSDLVTTILISELAAIPMQDLGTPLITGIIPIATLVVIEIFVSFIGIKSLGLRRLFNGKATIIIRRGRIDQKKLKEMRITVDEVLEALRQNNIESVSQIKYGVIEANGKLSYVLQAPYRPMTAQMMPQAISQDSGLPLVVISDGKLVQKNLRILGKDEHALVQQVKKAGIQEIRDVFLMTLDDCGNTFLQEKERKR